MHLDISKITSYGFDWEINYYNFLQTINNWKVELSKNKLYPVYDYSIQLMNKLYEILDENMESKDWLDREVRGNFLNDQLVVMGKAHQISFQLEKLINFVKWGIDVNKEFFYEANVIRQFIYDNIEIVPISDISKYRGKGYVLVPNNKLRIYNIYLYELSISWDVDDPTEYLEMELLRSIPFDFVEQSPQKLMGEFVKNNPLIYDPMIYICITDLDFPFKESLMPVVENKLLESINGLTPYM